MSLSHQRRQGDGTVDGQQLEELKKLNKSDLYKMAREFAPNMELSPLTKSWFVPLGTHNPAILNFDGRFFGHFFVTLDSQDEAGSNNARKCSILHIYDGGVVVSQLTRIIHGDDILTWGSITNKFTGFATALALSKLTNGQQPVHSAHVQFIGYQLGEAVPDPEPEPEQPRIFNIIVSGSAGRAVVLAEYGVDGVEIRTVEFTGYESLSIPLGNIFEIRVAGYFSLTDGNETNIVGFTQRFEDIQSDRHFMLEPVRVYSLINQFAEELKYELLRMNPDIEQYVVYDSGYVDNGYNKTLNVGQSEQVQFSFPLGNPFRLVCNNFNEELISDTIQNPPYKFNVMDVEHSIFRFFIPD